MSDGTPGADALTGEGGTPPGTGEGGTPPADPFEGGALAGLDSETQAWAAKKGYTKETGVGAILGQYRQAEQKLSGKDVIAAPRLDDPAQRDQWEGWAKLGVPDKPEGYAEHLQELKLPDGMELDKDLDGKLQEAGVKLKLAPWQVQGLRELYAGIQGDRYSAMKGDATVQAQELQTALRGLYGNQLDAKLAAGRAAATQLVRETFGEGAGEERIGEVLGGLETAMGSEGLVRFFVTLSEKMGGGKPLVTGQGGAAGGEMTPQQAQAEQDRLLIDKDFMAAYQNKGHQGHQAAVERMAKLTSIKMQGKKGG